MAFVYDYEEDHVIDQETGAYLTCDKVLVTSEIPGLYDFSFYWQGERIEMEAYEKVFNTENPGPNEKSDYHWQFYKVSVPEHLSDQREKIIEMIRQAFEVYGSGLGSRFEKKVTAEYLPP